MLNVKVRVTWTLYGSQVSSFIKQDLLFEFMDGKQILSVTA